MGKVKHYVIHEIYKYKIPEGTPLLTYAWNEEEQATTGFVSVGALEDIYLEEEAFLGERTCSNPECDCLVLAFRHGSLDFFTVSPDDVMVASDDNHEHKEAA